MDTDVWIRSIDHTGLKFILRGNNEISGFFLETQRIASKDGRNRSRNCLHHRGHTLRRIVLDDPNLQGRVYIQEWGAGSTTNPQVMANAHRKFRMVMSSACEWP
jgi:hypothetical protein